MKFKITCRPRIRNSVAQKFISSSLVIGLLLNSTSISLASILSEDGRYETFEGSNITINDILEEDKVDVEIEGNTMVNVANQKDPVPITKKYTVEGTNHIPLQGEYDGKARPVIEGSTMYYNNDTGEYSDTFIEGANLSLVSSFEDQLVTQEMIDSGLEKQENLGKYKVEIKTTGKNKLNPEWLPEILKTNSTKYGVSIKIKDNKIIQSGVATETYTELGINIIDYLIDGVKYVRENRISLGLQIVNHDNTFTYPLNEPFTVDKSTMKEIRLYYQIEKGKNYSYEHKIPQLEEGSIITEYEPYKESIKTFYLNSPLLEGDTIEDINGKATHVKRYNKVILDGSTNLNAYVTPDSINDTNRKTLWAILDRKLFPDRGHTFISNKFKFVSHIDDVEGIGFGSNVDLMIEKSKLISLDNLGLSDYFSKNPTTIVYRLVNPIYETISEESILCDSYTNGHLDLNSNIPVSKVDFVASKFNLNYLYPSMEYTVQFESDNKGKIEEVLLGDEVLYGNYSVSKGINRFNITTPSEISSTELILDGIGFNLSNLVVTEAVDESFDYFEGIKSVGQDDVSGHNIEVISNNSDKTQSNKIQIPLSEPLRSLPNGVKDKIIKKDGQWYVERNCGEITLNGSENWGYNIDGETSQEYYLVVDNILPLSMNINDKFISRIGALNNSEYIRINNNSIVISLFSDIKNNSYIKRWLADNPVTVIYALHTPIYESIEFDSLSLYLDTTHISTNSTIPANLKVIVDRVANRAKEFSKLAKENPTIENISLARMWTNKMRESILKDEFQDNIDTITEITDMTLERKTVSANLDVYIKSENMLSMNLSTNSITFDDFSGVEDMIKENAVNISINSSLPYNLNAYLATEIQNNDKSSTMNKDILGIKDNSETDYQTFSSTNNKITLKSNCNSGNDKQHDIDLKLNGGIAHEKDVYKTTIKFEAEQQ